MIRLLLLSTILVLAGCASPVRQSDPAPAETLEEPGWVNGRVFHDHNDNGRLDGDEPGVARVLVSNGLEVVLTDPLGRYRLPLRDDMNLTVVQPSGWRVPVDERQIPQFFRIYKAGGSPPLRYGGLPDSAPPGRVDFALNRAPDGDAFRCVVVGDSQTYSNDEVSHFRDSAGRALLDMDLAEGDCLIYIGDVVGDDLDLLDRLLAISAGAGVPQWLVRGNHDLDFDATRPADSADSWRQRAMPDYYAFEIGQVLFVTLNNVVYPCGTEDAQRAGREFCVESERPRYNGRLPDLQLAWLDNLLAQVPADRRIVLLHHVPLVSFSDADSAVHQTDNAAELHALVAGRPALSIAGHTHTTENLAPGDWFAGWQAQTGIGPLPFRHLIAGAASGGWWLGDFGLDSVPMALQRMGSPRGLLTLDFTATDVVETYQATSFGAGRAQWIGFNTPAFRAWHQAIAEWMAEPADRRDPVPPRSLNDLPDPHLFSPPELAEGVYLTANVWLGSSETTVTARINGGPPLSLTRTQAARGEAPLTGPEYADPFATRRILSHARSALVSRSGNERAQGYEGFQGVRFDGLPGPQGRSAPDRNGHLWRLRLPADLPVGSHSVEVSSTDRHGRTTTDRVIFEVATERPARHWDNQGW